jgi:hypothetical protein
MEDIDTDWIDKVVLALLHLGLHVGGVFMQRKRAIACSRRRIAGVNCSATVRSPGDCRCDLFHRRSVGAKAIRDD